MQQCECPWLTRLLCVPSECIKIQPTDIQPDVFSYLLHIMYTGMCPKQPVEQSRLQEGIKFLHAYQLSRKPSEGANDAAGDGFRMSNLYGIQISSQLANKDVPRVLKSAAAAAASRGAAELGRSSGRRGRSLTFGLDGVPADDQTSTLHKVCSVASENESDVAGRIKQERLEEEEEEEDGEGEEEAGAGSPGHGLHCKERPSPLLCPRCGERCSSPQGLREHLFSHALDPAHLVEGLSQGGEPDAASEEVDTGCLEEALRQSQALANRLAAELRRSRGGGQGCSPAPAALHSRKRKIACAVCSLRFAHKSQLQEHMYAHTGRPSRLHRYHRLCSQLFQGSAHFCEASPETAGGGGASGSTAALSEEAAKDTQDNGSSCYSLDSEVSQESIEGVPAE